MLNFDVKIDFDEGKLKIKQKLSREEAQFALDQQVLKDSNYFIPKQEAYLEKSGILHSRIGTGHIEWKTPYARRLYYNPQYDFSKDVNPNAQGLWFEAAKALHRKDWADTAGVPYSKIFNGK
ncbi:minor capsid protein [Metabacillus bambusae]|uniref:Minor capsid protein n=1 Tax=Metabacillus bambusae TaxID=2795218 RepID=A0ABS3NCE2_9BACI|nr:minor capsid protein [Metabacillus bambusae]MBO1515603.1 minor capsid protein [Metabacillus bambusae]